MNPMDIFNMIKSIKNPEAIINMFSQGNPQMQQALKMANEICKNKNPEEMQNIAMNMAKEKGLNINDIMNMLNK